MDKRFSLLAGVALLLVGVLALASNVAASLFGLDTWHLWPLAVLSLGLLLVASPLLARGRRSLGALFIPGVPILTAGGALLFTSIFGVWGAWSRLWPLEVLALALGFLFAAVYTRARWLLIPTIVIGANGLLFQFCALTGWWGVWSVLWTIEPLSMGLALLVFGLSRRSTGLLVAGATLFGLGGAGLIGMTALVSLTTVWPGLWLLDLAGPLAIIAAGLLLVISSLLHRSTPAGANAGAHTCGHSEA
jgi:hypothetical protein